MKTHFISIISPVYQAEKNLDELIFQIEKEILAITDSYEIILVEDHSPDNSWQVIERLCEKNKKIKGIKLSRNFGQHHAISCGLKESKGEWVIIMDCDLQDNPSEINKLYSKALDGYEIVLARRKFRKHSFFKRFTSKLFYKIFSYLTDTDQDSSVSNFGIYHRKVVDAVLEMGDLYRVFPILVQYVGFNKALIDVIHQERFAGKSSYSKIKLLKLAFNMIISFSEKPLMITLKIGLLISFLSFSIGVFYLILYFLGEILVPGFTSLVILICFSTGVILTSLGICGLYIGKISNQIKKRPHYIIANKIN